eukprot:3548085-Prymnesium_polylepis.1
MWAQAVPRSRGRGIETLRAERCARVAALQHPVLRAAVKAQCSGHTGVPPGATCSYCAPA